MLSWRGGLWQSKADLKKPSLNSAKLDEMSISNNRDTLESGDVLESIPHLARQMVDAEYAALAIMDDDGRVVKFITSGIAAEVRDSIGDLPKGKGLLGALHAEARSIRIPDISQDSRSVGFPRNHPPMGSMLGVPIVGSGGVLGNLYLTNKSGKKEFTEHDQRVVEAFAKYAATAIENDSLRVEAEEERGRLRAMIDSSAAAVIVADARDGRVVLSNQEAARMMGRTFPAGESKEGYEQAVVYRRADGGVYETKDLPLQQALKDGTVSRGVEVTLNLPDGREIPTIVNAAPVYGEDGEITAAIAIFEDITALQEVERVKAEFLSMVSHDLKGPLSGIKSMASALLMEHGPRDIETILEYLTSIDEETDRMTELVGNLVDMSRIEANAMPMDPEICHLADIVDESVRRFGRSRLGGQQRINVDVPLELPEIYADYDQVGRVITNLLSNASKYSSPGTEISIKAYLDSDEGATIVTEVRDEGVGIPDDEIDKIFDKFYRVITQRGRGRPGSGLGLAICRSIIMAHEGNIWVESKPGVGSTFRFSLPASIVSVGV